ncbi:fumarylacetoacetate hydrolase family protein [Haliea sp.]
MAAAGTRILPPLPRPRRMRDFSAFETHASSAGQVPDIWYRWPLYYKVNTYAVIGPDCEVTWPDASTEIDYELEIAAIIGKPGRGITKEQAREHIFGFTIFNDLSARDWQRCEFQAPLGPSRSKDFDGANVIGPCIVTLDEIPDIYALEMTAQVNGEEWSRGNTRTLYHSFEDMIVFVSASETLVAGELFGSGTVGSGCGMELGRFLARGDTVQLTVEHLGSLSTVIR